MKLCRMFRRIVVGFAFRKRCVEVLFLAHEIEELMGAEHMRASRAVFAKTRSKRSHEPAK